MKDKKYVWYAVFAIIAITLVGYLGYFFGFLGFINNIALKDAFSQFNIITLAIILGVAAFFSPCAFTVLPAYVSHYLADDKKLTFRKSLYFGILAALGIIAVNLAVGLVISLLGSTAPFHKDPRDDIPIVLGIRIVAGFLIAALGVMTLLGKTIKIPFLSSIRPGKNAQKSAFMYGILYNSAALGCTGPILLGLMLFAIASGTLATALLAFAVFSVVMGLLMMTMTVLIGLCKNKISERMISALPIIKNIAAIVMIVAGLAIAILTLEGNKLFVQIFFPHLT